MILGIGIDMTEIERIEKACEKQAFSMRIFTPKEREISDGRANFYAGRFAVKEALVKALGTGFRGISPQEIETLKDDLGKPKITLSGAAKDKAREMGVKHIHVSITHTTTTAAAIVVLEGGEGEP